MSNRSGKDSWKHTFLFLRAGLVVAAFILVSWSATGSLLVASDIADAAAKADAYRGILETLLSWEVVSGMGALVAIPKVPAVIEALRDGQATQRA